MTTYIGNTFEPGLTRMLDGNNSPIDSSDPDALFADVTRRQKEFVIENVRPFEQKIMEQLDSTELVDAVPQDVQAQTDIAAGIDRRNRERFGVRSRGAVTRERERAVQRGQNLNLAGGLNNARLQQDAQNRELLNKLVDFAGGINRSNLSSLGSAASTATARANAYTSARAQTQAQRFGFLGSLFSMI